MCWNARKTARKSWVCLLPLLAVSWVWACAANHNVGDTEGGQVGATDLKVIQGIQVAESDVGVDVRIQGGPELLYSEIRKPSPPSLSLWFPNTGLENVDARYPVNNELIQEIQTSEVTADGRTSKVSIVLAQEVEHQVETGADGLTISFHKAPVVQEVVLEDASSAADPALPTPSAMELAPAAVAAEDAAPASAATTLEAVHVDQLADGVDVILTADGAITDYTAFTIDDQNPRIVVDLYRLASPYKGLQKIDVESDWVKGLRHFSYPDKVRVVLDTDKALLTGFRVQPVANGLVINVSQNPGVSEGVVVPAAAQMETPLPPAVAAAAPQAPAPSVAESSTQPAWLNLIEFTGEDNGESEVLIGTTGVVQYEMEKLSERQLRLKLRNTRVPEYRKRPLITTRFKSAVDRVLPVQTPQMGNEAAITFDLRESVAFEVEQEDSVIRVRFAASAIPPKPLEQSALPEWKQALEAPMRAGSGATATAVDARDLAPAERGVPGAGARSQAWPSDSAYGSVADVLTDEGTYKKRIAPESLEEKRLYTGEKIALNFFETDIKNVFRILGEISQQNFAIDKDVTGRVTLNFEKPVPWDQVLDLVLKMNQLGRKEEDGIIRIATLTTLAKEEELEKQKLKNKREAEDEQELVTEFFLIGYVDARSLACRHLAALEGEDCGTTVAWQSRFSPRGSVSVDDDRQIIVINDVPKGIERAREIIRIMDRVTPQVLIEARIIEASSDFRRELGFDWGDVSIGSFALGSVAEITGISLGANNIPSTLVPTGSIGFGVSKLSGTPFDIVDAQLQVSESEGKSRTVSAPKILTLDGKEASIQQGFEFAYLERDSAGGSSVKFKNVDLKLTVTPKVTPDNRIHMTVNLKKDDVLDRSAETPALTTNAAQTVLLVEDGDTIVIGGIIKASLDESEQGLPGLRKIPVLGYLFKGTVKADEQNELLIFLTPKIVTLESKRTVSQIVP
jgi:type IV pilus assembly protein PilQ